MKKAIVVGGASGIGLALAEELMEKKYLVYIFDQKKPIFENNHYIDKFKFYPCQLLDQDYYDLKELSKDLEVDTLILTAGFGRVCEFDELSMTEIDHLIRVNALANIQIIKLFYTRISSSKNFYTAVMGSIAGLVSSPLFSVYAASKAAICRAIESINIELAVVIAMFHDLYELPWQNIDIKKIMRNKHGFVHPIEAITNAITWYPEYFENKDKAMVIIDGVLHHMFPLAVRRIDDTDMELNNKEKYEKLPQKYKDMIKLSTDIGKIGHYSLRKTFFVEGRIMSKADKIVALRKDIGSFNGYLALLSGKNKNIKIKHNKKGDNSEHKHK